MPENRTETPAQAVAIAKSFKGCDYWYACSGEPGTRELLEKKIAQYPRIWSEARRQKAYSQCDGKPKFDCIGLMRKATGNEKNATALNMNAEALRKASNPQPIFTMPEVPGIMLFIASKQGRVGHVGIYCGNGIVAEAHGFKQVDVWSTNNQKWEQWGYSPWINYSSVKKEDAKPDTTTGKQQTKKYPSQGAPLPQVVKEVLDGKWGNDPDRKQNLIAAGYNRDTVQDAIKASGMNIGDKVRVKSNATEYYPGLKMPKTGVAGSIYTIMQIMRNNQFEIKGNKVCVLLRELVTWCAVENLEFIKKQ